MDLGLVLGSPGDVSHLSWCGVQPKHHYSAMEESIMNISHTIKLLRRVRGWRQEDLASHSGVSARQIARLESARSARKAYTLARLASAFNTGVSELTHGVALERLDDIISQN